MVAAKVTIVEKAEGTRMQASNTEPKGSGRAMVLVIDRVWAIVVLDLVQDLLWHHAHSVGEYTRGLAW